ncbi:MAG: hypothetical protein JWQ35_1431 [Bacteriovoracaceae bacterium]|nr:hypothetical protein [Bacteriovoracaceae bacterium]
MGRRRNFLFLVLVTVSTASSHSAWADEDDKIINLVPEQPVEPTLLAANGGEVGSEPARKPTAPLKNLPAIEAARALKDLSANDRLKTIRSTPDHPVSLSIAEEKKKIRKIYEGDEAVVELDPMSKLEGLLLAKQLGKEFSTIYKAIEATQVESEKEEFREMARQRLRILFAAGFKYESRSERVESWFKSHLKSWYFISEFISITGSVVIADLALRAVAPAFPTFVHAIGATALVVGTGIVPSIYIMKRGREKKFAELFEAFLEGANRGQGLKLSKFSESVDYMNHLSDQLQYPEGFASCVVALKRISQ